MNRFCYMLPINSLFFTPLENTVKMFVASAHCFCNKIGDQVCHLTSRILNSLNRRLCVNTSLYYSTQKIDTQSASTPVKTGHGDKGKWLVWKQNKGVIVHLIGLDKQLTLICPWTVPLLPQSGRLIKDLDIKIHENQRSLAA